MTAILRDLPFRTDEDYVFVGTERVQIKPYQIVAWFSITPRNILELFPPTPRFPAIIDIGHNHNFSIQRRHVIDWVRTPVEALSPIGRIRHAGRAVPLHAANVWIHPNAPGKRDELSGKPPYLLRFDQGIAVYPADAHFPRLPLLGLRAVVRAKLHLKVDPEQCLVNLRTPDWRTRLLRWLW
jgi:hypothetical protein